MTTIHKLTTQSRNERGFTLIEIVVVISILSLVALLVLPLLPSAESANLRSSAKSLAAAIRYLGDRSVTAKTVYRMHLNLTDGTVTIRSTGPQGEELSPDDNLLGRKFLSDGIAIQDVELPRLGKVTTGEVVVAFGGAGLEEFLTIHLQGARGSHFTVAAFPNSGKVKVLDGYQEAKL